MTDQYTGWTIQRFTIAVREGSVTDQVEGLVRGNWGLAFGDFPGKGAGWWVTVLSTGYGLGWPGRFTSLLAAVYFTELCDAIPGLRDYLGDPTGDPSLWMEIRGARGQAIERYEPEQAPARQ